MAKLKLTELVLSYAHHSLHQKYGTRQRHFYVRALQTFQLHHQHNGGNLISFDRVIAFAV